MPERHSASTFLTLRAQGMPVLDVRSPAEFAKGSVPGALNLPVLDNEARAAVGTCYAQEGQEAAVKLGLSLVGPHMASMLEEVATMQGGKRDVLLYCWRGGMRSGSMAWLLETAGYTPHLLDGGYKGYRTHIRQTFTRPATILVLGGMTGCGKTDILHALHDLGCQVVDLEGLANHRGSAFGSIGLGRQPTNETFENRLFDLWQGFDPDRPIWMEDESLRIGSVTLCAEFFHHIATSRVVEIDLPHSHRVARLVAEYSQVSGCPADEQAMRHALDKIQTRLGGLTHSRCVQALAQHDYAAVAAMLLGYYDKAYKHHGERLGQRCVHRINATHDDPAAIARLLATQEAALATLPLPDSR